MAITGLPGAFDGYRVAHLSDLHVSTDVPYSYLLAVVDSVNRLGPDLVVVTGDLVSHGTGLPDHACRLLARLRAPTLVSFGNHDYGKLGAKIDVAPVLEAGLRANGITVLRNSATAISLGDERLWFVGLEDLWSGRFSPGAAFARVGRSAGEPVIAMSHNPDTAPALESYGAGWILAGHTHGGQVRLPGWGAIMLPVQNRQWQQGLYQVRGCRMYVSRGVGYLMASRFACRPEVPIFTLRPA